MTTITDAGSIFVGTDEDDSATALATNIRLEGVLGDDWLSAVLFDARPGQFGLMSADLIGGGGNDVLHVLIDDTDQETAFVQSRMEGGDGDDMIGSEVASSAGSSNWTDAGAGDDVIRLESRQTFANPDAGYVTLSADGGAGDDRITLVGSSIDAGVRFDASGGAGDDWITLKGVAESGVMFSSVAGNLGNDTLFGSNGDDLLTGGQGDDYLRGFAGDDTFEFQSVRAREADRIADFTLDEDVIDVSRIDANIWRGGNQTFTFDESGNGGTGRLWVEDNPDSYGSLVYADTGRAILTVALLDGRGVDATDYGASDFIL